MKKPTRIPIKYAYTVLGSMLRGYEDNPGPITMQELNAIAVKNGALVPVAKLRHFFARHRDYQQFKESVNVPDWAWDIGANDNPEIKTYARQFMTSRRKRSPSVSGSSASGRSSRSSSSERPCRKRKKYITKVGSFSDDEISKSKSKGTSFISIKHQGKRKRQDDPNLPLAVCADVRRMCKKYDKRRKYMKYPPDESDNQDFLVNIDYV